MKVSLKVEHLATGKTWVSDSIKEDIDELEGFCVHIAQGDVSYLELSCAEKVHYFTEEVLKGCVVTLVKEVK